MAISVGTVAAQCPAEDCGAVVDIPVTAEFETQGDRQYLVCEPDMSDLWAHAWSHGVTGNYGDEERA